MTNDLGVQYQNYVLERLNAKVFSIDCGFIVYRTTEKECFIFEMFVEEQFRKRGNGKVLLYKLCDIAESEGAERLTANIFLFDKNASDTLLCALSQGFKVAEANGGRITVFKTLED